MLEYRLREKVAHGSSQLPFHVYHVDHAGGNRVILPIHWHEEIELIYVRKGGGVFTINHASYEAHAGDCLIVNAGELHSGISASQNGCSYSAIVFKLSWLSGLHPDLGQETLLNPLLRGSLYFPAMLGSARPEYAEILEGVRRLIADFDKKETGYSLKLKGGLLIWLALISPRLISRQNYERSNPISPKWKKILKALEYIDGHYKQPLTLEELAEIATVAPSHFCRLFKELSGFRPLEYINLLRVNSAAQMLLSTTCTVLDAAMENGFQHLSHFGTQFKKHMKVTPSQYKSQHDNRHPF